MRTVRKTTMMRETFESYAQAAKIMAASGHNALWNGYSRGLRRCYYGNNFGTEQDHQLWQGMPEGEPDESRRLRGIGYRLGFAGLPPAEVRRAEDKLRLVTR